LLTRWFLNVVLPIGLLTLVLGGCAYGVFATNRDSDRRAVYESKLCQLSNRSHLREERRYLEMYKTFKERLYYNLAQDQRKSMSDCRH